ncbi:MAG: helix-turn-helix domain-containing protein [Actinomycetota bacterium]
MIVGSDVTAAVQHLPLPDAMEFLKVYLREHLADQIRIKHLAALVALSPFYFVRTFKEHVGVPPHRYLTTVRIERACELLATSSLTATQICARVGFTTLSHFTNTFRKHTGMTPIAYRRAVTAETAPRAGSPVRRGPWGGPQDRATLGQQAATRPGMLFP